MSLSVDRLCVAVPSVFVVPQVKPPPPPPVPGTVTAESLQPPKDPPRPFLVPWKPFAAADQRWRGSLSTTSIPCDVDASKVRHYLERHDVERTVRTVFKDKGEDVVRNVMASLESTFVATGKINIVWTVAPRITPNPKMQTILRGKKQKRHVLGRRIHLWRDEH